GPRADTHAWGTVGYGSAAAGDQRAAADWLADWAGRPDARPWMLINLVLALRALGRAAEANAVGRHAAGRPADHTTPYHELWLAAGPALAGGTAAAGQRPAGGGPPRVGAPHRVAAR